MLFGKYCLAHGLGMTSIRELGRLPASEVMEWQQYFDILSERRPGEGS